MIYKYKEWTLYCKKVLLNNSEKLHTIYFLSKYKPKNCMPCELPPNYQIEFNDRIQLPYLKKIK
jgi:hypothetical protein